MVTDKDKRYLHPLPIKTVCNYDICGFTHSERDLYNTLHILIKGCDKAMPEGIKRTPTINIVIQEFSVLERLDTIAEVYDRDRNTLINQVLKHFVENMEQYKEILNC